MNAAIEALIRIRSAGDKRLGVFWHTQGSGKSLSMLWFTQKVLRRMPGAWTFVMVTDRIELDDQLHGEFADAGAISKRGPGPCRDVRPPAGAAQRRTTATCSRLIQKFRHQTARGWDRRCRCFSERDDVIVITDEAHRSQYDTLGTEHARVHCQTPPSWASLARRSWPGRS